MATPEVAVQFNLEAQWHSRWRCKCPCQPPHNTSKVFRDAASERASQLHCLRFLWECHVRATGDAYCPWDLQ
eukprot:1847676-Prorocentrum_lima.AAC.1